jgi:hypothetical protein
LNPEKVKEVKAIAGKFFDEIDIGENLNCD